MSNDTSAKDIEMRLKQVYSGIQNAYKEHQDYQWKTYGIEAHDNGLDALLVYLISKRIIDQG
jgi:hypothetical protein